MLSLSCPFTHRESHGGVEEQQEGGQDIGSTGGEEAAAAKDEQQQQKKKEKKKKSLLDYVIAWDDLRQSNLYKVADDGVTPVCMYLCDGGRSYHTCNRAFTSFIRNNEEMRSDIIQQKRIPVLLYAG